MPVHPTLFSIHGIRTVGAWQDRLTDELRAKVIFHKPYRFGWFGLPRFLFGPTRAIQIERFHRWYIEQRDADTHDAGRHGGFRPSIIAHSFGSYIVGECMLKYREVRFDKIILCGSILPRSFEWSELLARNQVMRIRNEYGLRDRWSGLVSRFVPRTGDSGRARFEFENPCMEQLEFKYHKHSDYFEPGHIAEHWCPFLEKPSRYLAIQHGRETEVDQEFTAKLDRAHEIDVASFKHIPRSGENLLPRGLSTQWILVNPDIYTFLLDQNAERVVGYLNAMPVKEEVFDELMRGEKGDPEVTADDIVLFDRPGDFALYIMCVAIEASARRVGQGVFHEALGLLVNALEDKLLRYYRQFGFRVRTVGAVGWTPEGKKLCELLGMQRTGHEYDGHPTYTVDVTKSTSTKHGLGNLMARLSQAYQQ
jgi:pimeloyl-ACP methyl ester carboxylesterase